MATVTFTLVGNLADFGTDPRAGVRVRIVGTPRIKVDDGTIYSDQPETVTTDSTGAFTADLISTPGLWYQVTTPFVRAINPVYVAAYVPDPDDPTTGTAFAAGVTVDLADVMDEDPTPGYDGVFIGGGGGVTDHAALTGRTAADQHPMSAITGLVAGLAGKATAAQGAKADTAVQPAALAAHEADTTAVHGIADTAALVVTTDPRLSDARAPLPHTSASVTDFTEAAQDAIAALLAGASGVTLSYDDTANTLTITGPGAAGLDAEAVRDAIGVALVGTGLLTVTVNDALDTITLSTTATANATDDALRDRSTHTGTQAAGTITGLATVATTGAYLDLTGKPPLGTAAGAAVGDFAAAAHNHDSRYFEAHTFSVSGPISVATGAHRIYVEGAYVIESVRAAVGSAPTGAAIIVDVNKNGTTVFTAQSNRPQIAIGALTATSGAIAVTALTSGDYVTVDVDQVGSLLPGSDLTVTVRLRKT